jgi:hypothetical protein
VILAMSKLISAPYRQGQDHQTKMRVGCIKMLVHLCVGMFTLVKSLFVLIYKHVSI